MLNIFLKLKNKKGFTMIEMIIVLVIIAILAAVAVPTMIGYVQQARDVQYISEARAGFNAAQAVAVEMRAMGTLPANLDNIFAMAQFTALIPDIPGTFSNLTASGTSIVGITYTRPDVSRVVRIAATGTSVTAT